MKAVVQGQWVALEQEQAFRAAHRRAELTSLAGAGTSQGGVWSPRYQASPTPGALNPCSAAATGSGGTVHRLCVLAGGMTVHR